MTAFLSGTNINLRALTVDDATTEYVSWLNDPEVTKGLASGNYPTTVNQLREFISRTTSDPSTVFLAICDKASDKHIGNVKLDKFDWLSRTCEFGLLIGDKTFHRKGIGEEVTRLAVNYAFNQLNIRKILLAVYANNPGAMHLYQKIGFQLEGTLKRHVFSHGEFLDKHLMGLFAEDVK